MRRGEPPDWPLIKSLHKTSMYLEYTWGRMWLNFVMKACFNQSTKHSLTSTVNAGENVVKTRFTGNEDETKENRDVLAIVVVVVVGVVAGIEVESSTRFRSEMMNNIKAS